MVHTAYSLQVVNIHSVTFSFFFLPYSPSSPMCLKFGKETARIDFIPSSQYPWYKKVPGRDLPVRRMELTPVSKSLYEPREGHEA